MLKSVRRFFAIGIYVSLENFGTNSKTKTTGIWVSFNFAISLRTYFDPGVDFDNGGKNGN